MTRPIVDETLCFVCQELPPTHKVTRGKETFIVCSSCASAIQYENNARNRVKQSLNHSDTRGIFKMTLGLDLLPVQITVEKL